MKHFVNSANVGIKFRTGVPFFAENHCRVNQLFNIYSVLDSQYIVCFREKAFHTYCLTGSEQRFFTIGYVGFFYPIISSMDESKLQILLVNHDIEQMNATDTLRITDEYKYIPYNIKYGVVKCPLRILQRVNIN